MRTLFVCLLGFVSCQASQNDDRWQAAITETETLIAKGRYPEARVAGQGALRIAAGHGAADIRVGIAWNHLAWIDQASGRLREAETGHLRAMQVLRKFPSSLAYSMELNDLATLYAMLGENPTEIERMRRRALEIAMAELGPQHPKLAVLLTNLAGVRFSQGAKREARALLDKAMALGLEPLDRAWVLANLSGLCLNERRFAAALDHGNEVITIRERELGPEHPDLVLPLLTLGRVHLKLGHASIARQTLRRAIDIAEERLGQAHPAVIECLTALATVTRKLGDRKEARALSRRANAVRAQSPVHAGRAWVQSSASSFDR
jgi:tetratricopeptide (TPR) repeat protein